MLKAKPENMSGEDKGCWGPTTSRQEVGTGCGQNKSQATPAAPEAASGGDVKNEMKTYK